MHTRRDKGLHLTNVPLTEREQPVAVDVSRNALEIILEITPGDAATCGLHLTLAQGDVHIGYRSGELFIERSEQPRIAVPLSPSGDRIRLHVFLDQDIVEIFGGHGEAGMTAWLPYGCTYQTLTCYAEDGTAKLIRLDVWQLRIAENDTT